MAVGCSFITCAARLKGVEFCGECSENNSCERWKKHREAAKRRDSFKCYQKLEDDILFILENGIIEFDKQQRNREQFLKEMLMEFNDGRSKSYYCIAATLLKIEELEDVLKKARQQSKEMQSKEKAKVLRSLLEHTSNEKGYLLKLRK